MVIVKDLEVKSTLHIVKCESENQKVKIRRRRAKVSLKKILPNWRNRRSATYLLTSRNDQKFVQKWKIDLQNRCNCCK